MPPESARRLLREASLELARLRRVRGAYRTTWRRIARAQARLAFAAALLATPLVAEPASAIDPLLRHGLLAVDNAYAIDGGLTFADIDGDGDSDLFGGRPSRIQFFENTGSAAEPAFAPGQTNPFGLTSVAALFPHFGDLDADGDLDALFGGATQSFYFENTGTAAAPAFAAPVTNAFGLSGTVLELADLDGDGDLDVFRAAAGGTVLLENTGTASAPAFAGPVTSPFGLSSFARHFADLDGDGDLDALVGVYSYTFAENTGSATAPAFAAPGALLWELPGFSRGGADLADLDGDGDLDGFAAGLYATEFGVRVVFENVGGPNAPAFTNLGNPFGFGTFSFYAQVGYAYPFEGASSALADIDGDGDFDGFVFAQANSFLQNTGTASAPAFAPDPIAPLDLSGNDPVLADLDGDGDTDALVGLGSGDLLFFENTGASSAPAFADPATNPFGLADVGGFAAPDLADLDGDGDLDALIGNGGGDSLFFENTGTAGAPDFAAPQTNPFGLSNRVGYASPTLVDLDGDGDLDAVIGTFTGNVFLFANTGSATAPAFAAPLPNAFGLTDVGSYASPDFADIDGDGDFDALLGRSHSGVLYFRNTGSAAAPAFATPTSTPFGLLAGASFGSYTTPDLADVDGDGDLDAVIATLSGVVTYFRNVRDAASPPFFVSPASSNPFGVGLREGDFVDIDADGDLDLFSGTNFQENTGSVSSPGFGNVVSQPFGLTSAGSFSASRFVDLDADGDLDAVIGRNDGNLLFFDNTGSASSPAFGAPSTNPFGLANVSGYASPDLADLDGDGDLDALIGGLDGNTRFFENTGSPAAPAFAPPLANPFGLVDVGQRASPQIVDVDGDGDLDVLVGDQLQRIVFFENVTIDDGACTDGLDNDGDGRIDLGSDAGCANAADTSELSALQCDNGLDDDGDGKIDWRSDGTGDPHCSGLLDDRELPPPPAGPGCGIGPELLLLGPLLAARRRRSDVTDG